MGLTSKLHRDTEVPAWREDELGELGMDLVALADAYIDARASSTSEIVDDVYGTGAYAIDRKSPLRSDYSEWFIAEHHNRFAKTPQSLERSRRTVASYLDRVGAEYEYHQHPVRPAVQNISSANIVYASGIGLTLDTAMASLDDIPFGLATACFFAGMAATVAKDTYFHYNDPDNYDETVVDEAADTTRRIKKGLRPPTNTRTPKH